MPESGSHSRTYIISLSVLSLLGQARHLWVLRANICTSASNMPTTNTAGNPFPHRAYGLSNTDETRALYDEWASTFDADLNDPSQDYVGPRYVTEAVIQAEGNVKGTILDAGCGSGLSGIPLAKAGATTIDGLDLSPGMLKVAEKTGVYRHLDTADLSKPIDKPDATYDIVTCVGTLTHGHVGPDPAMKELCAGR